MDSDFSIAWANPKIALLLHGEACPHGRPASQSNQHANWAVEEGYCESAFAVSGQTRIHLESSARGAVRVFGAQIQNNR